MDEKTIRAAQDAGTRWDAYGKPIAPEPVAPTVEPLPADAGTDARLTRAIQQLDALGHATEEDRANLVAAIGQDGANRALSATGNPFTATNPGPGGGGPRNSPPTGGLDAQLADAAASGDWARVAQINSQKLQNIIDSGLGR